MSKHEADQSATTRIREHAAAAIAALGGVVPDRNGKHRAVEAFNPATGATATFQKEPTA